MSRGEENEICSNLFMSNLMKNRRAWESLFSKMFGLLDDQWPTVTTWLPSVPRGYALHWNQRLTLFPLMTILKNVNCMIHWRSHFYSCCTTAVQVNPIITNCICWVLNSFLCTFYLFPFLPNDWSYIYMLWLTTSLLLLYVAMLWCWL